MTCIEHQVHGVAGETTETFPDIEKLISIVKRMFDTALLRVQRFKQDATSTSLPPQPVLRRWDT
jgi:hypothetical protein